MNTASPIQPLSATFRARVISGLTLTRSCTMSDSIPYGLHSSIKFMRLLLASHSLLILRSFAPFITYGSLSARPGLAYNLSTDEFSDDLCIQNRPQSLLVWNEGLLLPSSLMILFCPSVESFVRYALLSQRESFRNDLGNSLQLSSEGPRRRLSNPLT